MTNLGRLLMIILVYALPLSSALLLSVTGPPEVQPRSPLLRWLISPDMQLCVFGSFMGSVASTMALVFWQDRRPTTRAHVPTSVVELLAHVTLSAITGVVFAPLVLTWLGTDEAAKVAGAFLVSMVAPQLLTLLKDKAEASLGQKLGGLVPGSETGSEQNSDRGRQEPLVDKHP